MKKETLKIEDRKQLIHFSLAGHHFMEGETVIVYVPSMEISGYGSNLDEAMQLIHITLEDFAKSYFALPKTQRISVLSKLGWKRDNIFRKRLNNLSNTTYEDIKKEFNLPDSVEIERIPVTA